MVYGNPQTARTVGVRRRSGGKRRACGKRPGSNPSMLSTLYRYQVAHYRLAGAPLHAAPHAGIVPEADERSLTSTDSRKPYKEVANRLRSP